MPPEIPGQLVSIDFKLSENRNLVGQVTRVTPISDHLTVTWYTAGAPNTYTKVSKGVVYVKTSTIQHPLDKMTHATPTKARGRYTWRDFAGQYGTMLSMILPEGITVVNPKPFPEEAKTFQKRIALFWILWPPKDEEGSSVEIEWGIRSFRDKIENQVEKINRTIRRSRRRQGEPDYEVALSFAGEDRSYVERVAKILKGAGIDVFYDKYEQTDLWGKNLYEHLADVYTQRARYTVMFISKHYRDKVWTNHERKAAQARALTQGIEYILPARFDDTEVPGLLPTVGYVSLKDTPAEKLANMIIEKLERGK